MQGKHLYEYAVIRLVPRVEREEFFNVGVILFSKKAGYIKSVCQVNEDKLKLYISEVDRESVFAHLDVFNKICSGAKDGGPIAQLDVPERFRWLTAVVHIWKKNTLLSIAVGTIGYMLLIHFVFI